MSADIKLCAVLAALPADAPVSWFPRQHAYVYGDVYGDNNKYVHYYAVDPSDCSLGNKGEWTLHLTRMDAQGRRWTAVGGKFTWTASGGFVEIEK
jgi:hypothetical protein